MHDDHYTNPILNGTNPATGLPMQNGVDPLGNSFGQSRVGIAAYNAFDNDPVPATEKPTFGVQLYQLTVVGILIAIIISQAM